MRVDKASRVRRLASTRHDLRSAQLVFTQEPIAPYRKFSLRLPFCHLSLCVCAPLFRLAFEEAGFLLSTLNASEFETCPPPFQDNWTRQYRATVAFVLFPKIIPWPSNRFLFSLSRLCTKISARGSAFFCFATSASAAFDTQSGSSEVAYLLNNDAFGSGKSQMTTMCGQLLESWLIGWIKAVLVSPSSRKTLSHGPNTSFRHLKFELAPFCEMLIIALIILASLTCVQI